MSDSNSGTGVPLPGAVHARVSAVRRRASTVVNAAQNTRTLSIVIPVKDGAATLLALLDALKQQQPVRGWRVEIVAGHTPSRDDTMRILQERNIRFNVSEIPGPQRLATQARVSRLGNCCISSMPMPCRLATISYAD